MSVLPWPDLLLGAHRLGLTPAQFWALSVVEWRALVGAGQGLDRQRLVALSEAFPDLPFAPPLSGGAVSEAD